MRKEWRDIPGYEGIYLVSSIGTVMRADNFKRKMLQLDRIGYVTAKLSKEGVAKRHLVHRLVALAFLGSPTEGRGEVNHKDGSKTNNQVWNLEWCSRSENVKHAFSTGLRQPTRGNQKLRPEDIAHAKRLRAQGYTHQEIGEAIGISRTRVGTILRQHEGAGE